jgi:hypothetical protein
MNDKPLDEGPQNRTDLAAAVKQLVNPDPAAPILAKPPKPQHDTMHDLNHLLAPGDAPPHIVEIYNMLRHALRAVLVRAAKGERIVLRLVCSRRTFTDSLDHPQLIAGPWEWLIADSVRYGDFHVDINGERVGHCSIGQIEIAQ